MPDMPLLKRPAVWLGVVTFLASIAGIGSFILQVHDRGTTPAGQQDTNVGGMTNDQHSKGLSPGELHAQSGKSETSTRTERIGPFDVEITPVAQPSKRKPLDKRLVGSWELVLGGDRHTWVDYEKTTLMFTASGTFVYSSTGKYNSDDDPPEPSYRKGQRYQHTFSGKVWALEDGTLEFVKNDEAFLLSPDLGSDTELLLVNGKGYESQSLEGKWRRMK